MSAQKSIILTICDVDGTVLRQATNFDGYIPRVGEFFSLRWVRYKVIELDWQWDDNLAHCNAVHMTVTQR